MYVIHTVADVNKHTITSGWLNLWLNMVTAKYIASTHGYIDSHTHGKKMKD